MSKVPMTVEGAERLKAELIHLKTVERPRIIQAIADARAHGDLKENAEYHAAREQQSFTEGRIGEIEGKLSNAQVIDVVKIEPLGKVIFGTTVTLLNLDTQEKIVYKIVGDDEASLKEGKISYSSPLSRSLIGHYEGENIEVKAPAGIINYEIIQVEHL